MRIDPASTGPLFECPDARARTREGTRPALEPHAHICYTRAPTTSRRMVRVTFTQNLQRHHPCPPLDAAGSTVRAVLDDAFAQNPGARGFVLDDQGHLRKHMVLFVNGQQVMDRERLSDPVPDGAELYVMQALSGG